MDKGKIGQIVVASANAGQRLDVFLVAQKDRLSRARIQALIRSGYILLNGKTSRAKQIIRAGDKVEISQPEPQPIVLAPEALEMPILFADEHLLVVNKPAGMTVHPGAGIQSGTLVNALLHHVSNLSGIGGTLRPGMVHRLDKETSGCLVVAKHDLAHLRLSKQFAARKVQKYYLALCLGRFTKFAGDIVAPIGRHPVHRQKMAVLDRGRPAHTNFEVIQETSAWALVLCQIFTGRTHQIRVHLHSIGHPVLGDKVYGKKSSEYGRQMLHAWRLGFFHPILENWLEFEAGLPDDFVQSGVEENRIIRARSKLGCRDASQPARSF
ncbi:MAG: RluA family pseudouridine synthase [Verrucomicrobia bacterium]|nr:RluA family pseudouridine synthase [Verrucomicrobiota bacterium]